ncbi:DUF6879 family protein [Nocardia miyunensis]|uniref:DUF6879 family protein n=1 Tax=Nocardia miyunensis TaxID=282684 RepID=UPI000833BF3D|nr:DUF6879 family protein [Nocardia miyunensis]
MELQRVDNWERLFRAARDSAFHLEVRDAYAEPSESEPLRRFIDGDPPPDYDKSDWTDLIRSVTEKGVSVSRVRVVTVPHTDYQRWLLSVTGKNVAAGEDIRYVPRHLAGEVPPDDWWLFDGSRVCFNLTDSAGGPAGIGITTDPSLAAYCRNVRQRLWQLAIPYREYVNQ